MFTLREETCPQQLADMLWTLHQEFDDLVAIGYANALGPWDDVIKKHQDEPFSFLFKDRVLYQSDVETRMGSSRKLVLTAAVVAIRNYYFFKTGGAGADPRYHPAAVILRRNAFIVLAPEGRHIYVQIPGHSTAHELMDDPAQLETEFPGMFEVA